MYMYACVFNVYQFSNGSCTCMLLLLYTSFHKDIIDCYVLCNVTDYDTSFIKHMQS